MFSSGAPLSREHLALFGRMLERKVKRALIASDQEWINVCNTLDERIDNLHALLARAYRERDYWRAMAEEE